MVSLKKEIVKDLRRKKLQQQQQASLPSVPTVLMRHLFLMDPSEQPVTGAAQRRKQRRLRSWWRHEQQSIAAALATSLHHSSRGQRKVRAGEEESETKYTGQVPDDSFSLAGALPAVRGRARRFPATLSG